MRPTISDPRFVPPPAPVGRMPMIDALKGISCILIVWHHLAFYGPMSDVALPLAPTMMSWLYDYGRMAVQVFLVVSGFLAAASLAPQGVAVFGHCRQQIVRRYVRLVSPYLVALAVSVAVAALVRPWLPHPAVPNEPGWLQVLSHVLLLQGVLGQESLSAGVWYVAIDFQLFVLTVGTLALARHVQGRLDARVPLGLVWVGALTLASLVYFNRHAELDDTALYFFGAYGLGMLVFWAGRSIHRWLWLVMVLGLGLIALLVQFRERIAIALLVAVWLGAAQVWPRMQQWPNLASLKWVGRVSYSVFLIHFPVCLLVSALVTHWWPAHALINMAGMVLAFVLSLCAGAVLYHRVEARRFFVAQRRVPNAFHASGAAP